MLRGTARARRARLTTSLRLSASSSLNANAQMTPEHIRLMRENRLRGRYDGCDVNCIKLSDFCSAAKVRIQQQAAAQNPDARLSVLGKRRQGPIVLETGTDAPHSSSQMMLGPNGNVISITPSTTRNANLDPSATHISPNKAKQSSLLAAGAIEDPNAPLPRDKSLGNYIEFDLSKLHNSKGGFLVDEEDDGKPSKSLQDLRAERERIRERLRDGMEPGINLADDVRCRDCGSRDVDEQFRAVFKILVCKGCQKRFPEKYSLLTKTEVKEDYLLTDSELRDPELLPHLLKANPHKSTYSNMMLYLRCQVEEYAFSSARWGSEAGLDAEFTRREQEKARRRESKFVKGLRDLRRKTRDNAWEKRQEKRHVCHFETVDDGEGGPQRQRCSDCGFEVEVEVL